MENQKRDFGNGFVGTLIKEVSVIREVPLGKDFIPPLEFEFAVDTNQYQMDNDHFRNEFKELAEVKGFGVLVDKVVDLEMDSDAKGEDIIRVFVNRKVYEIEMPKPEGGEQHGDNTVIQFKPRSV